MTLLRFLLKFEALLERNSSVINSSNEELWDSKLVLQTDLPSFSP